MKSPPLDAALGVGRFLLSAVCSLTLKQKLLSSGVDGSLRVWQESQRLPGAAIVGSIAEFVLTSGQRGPKKNFPARPSISRTPTFKQVWMESELETDRHYSVGASPDVVSGWRDPPRAQRGPQGSQRQLSRVASGRAGELLRFLVGVPRAVLAR